MARVELVAVTAFGLEAVVARELKNLGYENTEVQNGKISWTTNEEGICRANLWLRCADRISLKMGEFEARSFEELFQQTKALPWEEWLPVDACFPVTGKSVKSQLHSVPDCQAIVKKAIVERLKDTYGVSWFEETGALYAVQVSILKDTVTLTIDTSGKGLNKRGYRQMAGEAPLKETLAAAMAYLSYWNPDRVLLDPFCGTGTIPIEAAFIGQNRAPGLARAFSAERWTNIAEKHWRKAREEAEDLWQRNEELAIYGSDIDPAALRLAREHTREAGLEGKIFFQRLSVKEVRSRFKYGCIITNPPYGQRLGTAEEAETAYRELGEVLERLEDWSLHMLTSLPKPERFIKKRWDKSRKLYNGRIECHYYQFFGPKPPKDAKNNL
ncbi:MULTISPECIES: class I SAM-dependent RNA methyltransferase [Dehalobacter]|jgi:putative N6-adenine-specific DNA methylase|uniref:Methyltransferase n=2 Tax=Dehalobacter restrictus TaxID=55583 RepID=A0A857DLS7_9FIRM|nr:MULTISPECIES: class I SAM-dependent RNA methyltransferase [Dehalobacter]AHF11111.1 RNA methyltransferase [Dehalobacter restrictus DSM 9455]MCG1024629.1 class I SAM-dependent RNA methyltransferase [Dehalobacter sp.]MDJ0305258.1 class I SAM-dependent RNA methyltransferase [Dehalobacter sp.]OCZ53975.1 N-6 DNA methylase [Dehalobacter sp. TeCB1]QHA01763.1 methyltransferase [Dehalobacter restrictus]